jgi:hypothetical protein
MTRLLLSTLLALAASLTPCPGLDQATLDLALEAPTLNTNPGPEYADANRPGNMIIGLDRTPKDVSGPPGSAMATAPMAS